jgi:hypothetical protein
MLWGPVWDFLAESSSFQTNKLRNGAFQNNSLGIAFWEPSWEQYLPLHTWPSNNLVLLLCTKSLLVYLQLLMLLKKIK